MDTSAHLSEQRPEQIRREIDATRLSLSEKLDCLEDKVMHTISETEQGVNHLAGTVQSCVQETTQVVNRAMHQSLESLMTGFGLSDEVVKHPWPALTGAVGVGFLFGMLTPAARAGNGFHNSQRRHEGLNDHDVITANGTSHGFPSTTLAPEMEKLKALAIGSLMSLARDAVVRIAPPALAPDLERIIDNVTSKFGGTVLQGSLTEHGATASNW
jgi:ElaB/YqjD/DUF883 family membrane-anchored ribosome-binding protein